jgi:hypothetical protein
MGMCGPVGPSGDSVESKSENSSTESSKPKNHSAKTFFVHCRNRDEYDELANFFDAYRRNHPEVEVRIVDHRTSKDTVPKPKYARQIERRREENKKRLQEMKALIEKLDDLGAYGVEDVVFPNFDEDIPSEWFYIVENTCYPFEVVTVNAHEGTEFYRAVMKNRDEKTEGYP